MENNKEHKTHIVANSTNIFILVVLLLLTTLTVAVAGFDLGSRFVGVIIAMLVASVKATIVFTYFMHLKFENKMLRIFVGLTMMIFATIVLITIIDYAYR